MTEPKVTLLTGGNTVYVYPDGYSQDDIRTQAAVLMVAYPGDEIAALRIKASAWPGIAPRLQDEGLEIVDLRD